MVDELEQVAVLLSVHDAAIDWYNERVRINRTTYSPASAEGERRASDEVLFAVIEKVSRAIHDVTAWHQE